MELKKTNLYQTHVNLGANIVEFGGFLMPLYYTTIADEHHAVRNKVGMFDVSHMGEIKITGSETSRFVNHILTSKITPGTKMIYGLLCNEDGNVIDDLMVYPISSNEILLVVNASNKDKDLEWILKQSENFDVTVIDLSESMGEIALQGPEAIHIICQIMNEYPTHSQDYMITDFNGREMIISRSGYTGEDGFEIYGNHDLIQNLWDKFISLDVKPCGLGCRDTLRFEAAMPLYGHEIDIDINPLEAGLSFAVDFTKTEFIGKEKLYHYSLNPKRKLVGVELLERNVARAHYKVFKNDAEIGFITTGYLSPTVQLPIAMALVDINHSKIGTDIFVAIRDKKVPAQIRNRKFYQKKNKI